MKRLELVFLSAALMIAPVTGRATDYYVDNTASGASDRNNGITPSTPWLTIGRCASTIVAGDICNVLAGAYNEHVTVRRNGTSDSRITYKGSGVKMRGFTVNGNYHTFQGFEITNSGLSFDGFTRSFEVGVATGTLIYNNNIHHTSNSCIRNTDSTGTIIRGNTVAYCGSGAYGAGVFVQSADGMQTDILIEDNVVSYVSDFVTGGTGTSRVVIRNNTFGPVDSANPEHIDGFQKGCMENCAPNKD